MFNYSNWHRWTSFRLLMKLPDSTYFLISKRSSECSIQIGDKKKMLFINTRRLCLAILVRYVHQGCAYKGNFHFLLSNQKRGNYQWRRKTFRMLSAGPLQLAPRKPCFWPITGVVKDTVMTTSWWDFMARHLILVCRIRRQVPRLSYFQSIRILGVPDDIVLKSAFPCARPFRSLTIKFTSLVWTNF